MFKNIKQFLNRHIATWLFFLYALLLNNEINIYRTVKLKTSEEFIQDSYFWFFVGIFFFIVIELWRYFNIKYNIVPTDEVDEVEKRFSSNGYCHYGIILLGIIVLLRIFHIIQSNLVSVVLSVPFIVFIIYCFLKQKIK